MPCTRVGPCEALDSVHKHKNYNRGDTPWCGGVRIYFGGGFWFCCFFFPNSPRTCSTGFGCCCCCVCCCPSGGFFGPPSKFCSVPAIEAGVLRLGTSPFSLICAIC